MRNSIVLVAVFFCASIALAISLDDLPQEDTTCTGENETWRVCFGGCDPICEAPDRRCKACFDGCYCKEGFVRDRSNRCIKLADCPKTTRCFGPDEIYVNCAKTCPPGSACASSCKTGCVCKPGFFRRNGVCMILRSILKKRSLIPPPATIMTRCTKGQNPTPKPSHLPSSCVKFETYVDCLPVTEATCGDRSSIKSNPKECRPGCTCMPGYLRNNGKCIPVTECKPCIE